MPRSTPFPWRGLCWWANPWCSANGAALGARAVCVTDHSLTTCGGVKSPLVVLGDTFATLTVFFPEGALVGDMLDVLPIALQ